MASASSDSASSHHEQEAAQQPRRRPTPLDAVAEEYFRSKLRLNPAWAI